MNFDPVSYVKGCPCPKTYCKKIIRKKIANFYEDVIVVVVVIAVVVSHEKEKSNWFLFIQLVFPR